MPPRRTGQRTVRRSAAAAAPYCRNAKDRRIKIDRQHLTISGGRTENLSDDALARIFAVLSDTASVVRYAATCRRWGRVVATSVVATSLTKAECSVKIPTLKIRDIGAAVVRRGVAFWAPNHGVLGVRLDRIDDAAAATDMHLLPYYNPHYWPNNRLLGLSPDNRLFFMYVAGSGQGPNKIMVAKLLYLESVEDDDDIHAARKWTVCDQESVLMHEMKMTHHYTEIKLRWFGEKSGVVLFTLGERSGHNGTFTLSLREKVVQKVADDGDSWKNLLGYEMDMVGYLASVNQQSFT
ncbi:unnamed protein product [Alopecurus aequalis]